MKRILSIAVAVFMTVSLFSFAGCSEKREDILKIYNAADYIAEEGVIELFEEYYREKTGNPRFKVVYQTFDINETALTKIEKNKEDWDLVNISDYAVERLISKELLKPINISTQNMPNIENVSDYIMDQYELITGMTGDTTYAVGYMWGTMGILYNKATSETIETDVQSWKALWDEQYKGKVLMKNSVRDSYAIALLYHFSDQLLPLYGNAQAQMELITPLMTQTNDEKIEFAKAALLAQKELVNVKYEVDDGKDDIATGRGFMLSLAWSGDAGYAISEAADGVELGYVIPHEGSNVWFDGWVTPVYGKNQAAAEAFINFLLDPEIAIKNVDETGFTSVVATEDLLEYYLEIADTDDQIDASYFFGNISGYITSALAIDPVYIADKNDIERCGIMKDFGDKTEDVLKMWTEVKGAIIPVYVYIIIGALIIAGGGAAIYFTYKNKKNKKRPSLRKK